jgi:hypothetical protein
MFIELADRVDQPETSDAEPEYGTMDHELAVQVRLLFVFFFKKKINVLECKIENPLPR